METSTIFVLVTDKAYFYKTRVTINDLRTAGMWTGEIALITIDFNLDELDENYKQQNNILEVNEFMTEEEILKIFSLFVVKFFRHAFV